MKSNNNAFVPYGEKYGNGDVIGCYIDLNSMEISYSKNGSVLGKAFEIPISLKGVKLFIDYDYYFPIPCTSPSPIPIQLLLLLFLLLLYIYLYFSLFLLFLPK